MKTFNESDLITWSNRHDVKVGDNGYFANNITDLNKNIKTGRVYELMSISDNYNWCFTDGTFRYGFFLPKDAVKEEKKFRPLKNIEEFYELVFETEGKSEEDCIYQLIYDCILHLKSKKSCKEYYTAIRSICKNEDFQILINSSFTFEELFDEFEIELDGEWKPFGISDEDIANNGTED